MSGAAKVWPLHRNQMRAVDPRETVWLSASAGTGKTQVLSSRVLRLLLQEGVEPSQILCLTFTKAGATEMAARVNGTLAQWVRLEDTELAARLEAIGAPGDRTTRARARTLFAAVLDSPGGGLRIDTIHAFSQWLLATFPQEAGLVPGTRPMEDRERVLLANTVLADLLAGAQNDPLGDPALLDAAEALSIRHGPDEVKAFLLRCANARQAWFGPGSWQAGDMRGHVLRLLDLPGDADTAMLETLCDDSHFDVASLRYCRLVNAEWATKSGEAAAAEISAWLALPAAQRLARFDALRKVFLTDKDTPRSTTNLERRDPQYGEYAARVCDRILAIMDVRARLTLAERLVPALRLGRAFALAWDAAKQREGLIDFDDQIRRAAHLLGQQDQADWIRYKLDRRFDHILVDEAQDTNAAQWDIVLAIASEFWAGEGQHGDLMRTLFVVGDYKQAIFRFQGTSPENFRRAADRVRREMNLAAAQGAKTRGGPAARDLREYGLERSFRTAQPVLDFVDAAIEGIGHANFGLSQSADRHSGEDRPGVVALWRPVGQAGDEGESGEDFGDGGPGALREDGEEGEETWLSKPERQMADRIARQVAQWLDPHGPGFALHKGETRRARAGDIMVLVRQRKELAALIVGRLHAAGVAVAGVDRLRLGAPLAVKDLVSALRFALQPFDDLNLAALLVSPLIGWSQEDLLRYGYREARVPLWTHLRASREPQVAALRERLRDLLGKADFGTPQDLLQWLLVGPWQGRRRLTARLGGDANDPIDELLNAAAAYVATDTPSLAGFLAWFDAGDGEVKREADGAGNLVRVMTVHGSKGLQAPIVILADATGNPDRARVREIDLPDPRDAERRVPLPPLSKDEKRGPVAHEIDANRIGDEQEHWRLLYVAMTRAEEALFVGGALKPSDKGVPAPRSWYAALRERFGPEDEVDDPIWGTVCLHGGPVRGLEPAPLDGAVSAPRLPLEDPLPVWIERGAPAEPRPPRPLAPSALGEDEAPDPPWPPAAGRDAALRGTLVHRLLERLPDVSPGARADAANRWLARHGAALEPAVRDDLAKSALSVIDHPEWADLFADGSLAEVPIAAVVGGQVVAGTIDRLVIDAQRVRLVDFKTSRRPPRSLDEVPRAVLRQLAAYVAALEVTFPGRQVEAALLYTAAPRLIALPADIVAAHKPDLPATQ